MNETKRYIFLTPSIVNIGGAELYVSRKANFLREQGWDVSVVSYREGVVKISNLIGELDNTCRELAIPFLFTTKKIKKGVIDFFSTFKAKELIIESHTINLALWGEYLAKELSSKNICYLLSENYPNLSRGLLDFLKNKMDQKQLYGITENTIPMILGMTDYPYDTKLIAVGCSNSIVEDFESNIGEDIHKADYTIVSLGRLDKPYILSMVESVAKFAESHRDKKINIIVIGDNASLEEKKKIKLILDGPTNLTPYILGEMFPIPNALFKIVDVAIGSAGSALVCEEQGLPTIVIDALDFFAIGILGKTTKSLIYRKDEPKIEIVDLLEQVLIEKKYVKERRIIVNALIDYSKHLSVLEVPFNFKYYNVNSLPISIKDAKWKFFLTLFGARLFFYFAKK